jgi:hypothetical protein
MLLLASFIPEQKIKARLRLLNLQQPTFRRRTSIRERMKAENPSNDVVHQRLEIDTNSKPRNRIY